MIKIKRSVPIIGVGGATGSGKSSVAHSFSTHNAMIIDLDRLSHDLSQKGRRLWKAVVLAFGSGFLNQKGELQRKKLGRVVFKSWRLLFQLNRISHPIFKNEIKKIILHQPPSAMIVIDGAILFEAGLIPLVDCLIFVEAPEEQRSVRLSQKGLSPDDIRSRMKSQKFISCLRRRSHIIIENSATPEDLQQKINFVCQLPIEKLIQSDQKTG
jgi:dephospho-CoA kinase